MQVQAGATGVFLAALVPTGSALQAGSVPAWTTSDPKVTLTPTVDGFTVSAAVTADDVAASFNLTITAVNSAGATITDTVTVSIVAAPPPLPVPATGFTITQVS